MKTNIRSNVAAVLILASAGFLVGCGVTSNPNSASNGGGSPSTASLQAISPGEMAKIQNQKMAKLAPRELDEDISKMEGSDAIRTLYFGLSNRNPAIRKRSEESLTMLLKDDDQLVDELKKLQAENSVPDSWFSASQILSDIDKMRARSKEAEIKQMMEQ
jgi:hypothetical protein